MTHIKSPYNFVPLNEHVVTPEWADFISHDVPFRDAQSGELSITIKALSPMFVRNGAPKSKDDSVKVSKFSNFEGQYFLPGTSLKGMTRNVLEILTFSKMGNKVNDHRYAIRDLNGSMKDQYLAYFKPDSIYCGWLYKSGDTYHIEDCGLPGRIKHRHLDDIFQTDFASFYAENGGFRGNNNEHKSAKFKYEQRFNGHNRHININYIGEDAGRKLYEIDQIAGETQGTLVFTGQPGPRKIGSDGKWTGHHLEFVFLEPARQKTLKVDLKVIDNFFFAYLEHDKPRWSVDWEYWREKLLVNKEKIPVFFHRDGDEVTALGLSYLFKLPYKKSVVESMSGIHIKKDTDFSEAIFGYTANDDEFQALKGRVQFGHAFAEGSVAVDTEKKEVLSSPKASYYPNYIRQELKKDGRVSRYSTYMDDGARIAGWKRYPVHRGSTVVTNPAPVNSDSDKISTEFIPVEAGATFKGAIRYHNLHPIELGALLSSLTFHGSPNTFHSLGMAKPLGYGKISVAIEGLDNPNHYMGLFEAYMTKKVTDWCTSKQVKELLTMATEQSSEANDQLVYMKLDHMSNKNDFKEAKSDKEALDVYSKLNGVLPVQLVAKATSVHEKVVEAIITEYNALGKRQQQLRNTLEDNRRNFEAALDAKKRIWLNQLSEQKQKAGQQEAEQKRKLNAAQVKESGINWDAVNWDSRRNAFEDLQKLIKQFCTKYHGDNNYDRLIKNHPNGVLPEEYRAELLERLTKVFHLQTPNDQEKWRNANSFVLKKVKEWAGETAAQALQERWSNK